MEVGEESFPPPPSYLAPPPPIKPSIVVTPTDGPTDDTVGDRNSGGSTGPSISLRISQQRLSVDNLNRPDSQENDSAAVTAAPVDSIKNDLPLAAANDALKETNRISVSPVLPVENNGCSDKSHDVTIRTNPTNPTSDDGTLSPSSTERKKGRSFSMLADWFGKKKPVLNNVNSKNEQTMNPNFTVRLNRSTDAKAYSMMEPKQENFDLFPELRRKKRESLSLHLGDEFLTASRMDLISMLPPPPNKPAPPPPPEKVEIRCYVNQWDGVFKTIVVPPTCTVAHANQILSRKSFGLIEEIKTHTLTLMRDGKLIRALLSTENVHEVYKLIDKTTDRLVYQEWKGLATILPNMSFLIRVFIGAGVYKTVAITSSTTAKDILEILKKKKEDDAEQTDIIHMNNNNNNNNTNSANANANANTNNCSNNKTNVNNNNNNNTVNNVHNASECLDENCKLMLITENQDIVPVEDSQIIQDLRINKSNKLLCFILKDENNKRDRNSIFVSPNAKVGLGQYTVLSLLGKGAFGRVWRVFDKTRCKIVALKVMNKLNILQDGMVDHVNIEREIMESVDHPFIINLYESFQTLDRLYMVMECLEGGSLFNVLCNRDRPFSEKQAKFFVSQIILAIETLHRKGFVYRDLKLENILLDDHGYVRLTDFGLSHKIKPNGRIKSFSGSTVYLAPEIMINEGVHGQEVDWWCLGVSLFILLTQEPPFWNEERPKMYEEIKHGEIDYSTHDFSPDLLSVLKGLLHKDPARRMKGINLRSEKWFADVDWENILLQKDVPKFLPPKTRKQKNSEHIGVPLDDFEESFGESKMGMMASMWKDPHTLNDQFPSFTVVE